MWSRYLKQSFSTLCVFIFHGIIDSIDSLFDLETSRWFTHNITISVCRFCLTDDSIGPHPPQWPVVVIGGTAGFIGSIVDSFLDATVQYSGFCTIRKRVVNKTGRTVKHICGRGILDNHLVNFVSSITMGLLTPVITYLIWKHLDDTLTLLPYQSVDYV